jgi:hypothetical protein
MNQKPLFPNRFEKAVAALPSTLYRLKSQRCAFTASELAAIMFEEPLTHSQLIILANAMKAAGYHRHNNGRVVRIKPKQHGRYWLVCENNCKWSDADVRSNVKANPIM